MVLDRTTLSIRQDEKDMLVEISQELFGETSMNQTIKFMIHDYHRHITYKNKKLGDKK